MSSEFRFYVSYDHFYTIYMPYIRRKNCPKKCLWIAYHFYIFYAVKKLQINRIKVGEIGIFRENPILKFTTFNQNLQRF